MNDQDPKKAEQDIKNQIKEYRKLQQVADDEAFKTYFDNQLKLVADKFVWSVGTRQKKLGVDAKGKVIAESVDNIANWDDFCKWRGEIISRLQPLQEVYSAEAVIKYLQQHLDMYYKKNVS